MAPSSALSGCGLLPLLRTHRRITTNGKSSAGTLVRDADPVLPRGIWTLRFGSGLSAVPSCAPRRGQKFGGFTACREVGGVLRAGITSISGERAGKALLTCVRAFPPTEGKSYLQGEESGADAATVCPSRHRKVVKSPTFFLAPCRERAVVAQPCKTFDVVAAPAALKNHGQERAALLGGLGRRHEPAGNLAHGDQRAIRDRGAIAYDQRCFCSTTNAGMSPEEDPR